MGKRSNAATGAQLAAEEFIERLVDCAPPLTAEQRDKLAVLLRDDGADSSAA